MAVINKYLSKVKSFNQKLNSSEIDITKQDQMIQSKGVRVRLYKTILCPNLKNIDSGGHEIDCKLCRNNFIDRDPIESWVYIGNQSLEKAMEVQGVWDDTNAYCTFLSSVEIQYFTRVELLDYTSTFYELIQRQEGEIDRLKYPALKINICLDKNGVEYYEGTDFKVSSTGDMQWTTDRRPAKGVIYSVHYEHLITFRAISAVHINRFGQKSQKMDHAEPVQFSQQWVLKRDFLVSREDLDGNPLTKNALINPYTK